MQSVKITISMSEDINGRLPKVGDVVWRKNSWNDRLEFITGFTGNGNPKVSYPTHVGGGQKEVLYANGYITTTNYVIVDTPGEAMLTDAQLECINEERKNLGLKPLKRYGNS